MTFFRCNSFIVVVCLFFYDSGLLALIEYFKISLKKINAFFPYCYFLLVLKYIHSGNYSVSETGIMMWTVCSIWDHDQCQNECQSLNQLIGIRSRVCFFPFEPCCFFYVWLTFGKPQECVNRLRFTWNGERHVM